MRRWGIPSRCFAERPWWRTKRGNGAGRSTTPGRTDVDPCIGAVRQQILLEPMGTPVLFAIQPAFAIRVSNPQDQAEFQPLTDQTLRPEQSPVDKALSYEAYSPPSQVRQFGSRLDREHPDDYRELPDNLGQLVELAKKLTDFKKRPAPASRQQIGIRNRRAIDKPTTICATAVRSAIRSTRRFRFRDRPGRGFFIQS